MIGSPVFFSVTTPEMVRLPCAKESMESSNIIHRVNRFFFIVWY